MRADQLREAASRRGIDLPVPAIYGVTYAFYRPASVGQAAVHLYPTENLRFELELAGELMPGWQIMGGYTNTRTKYLIDTNASNVGQPLRFWFTFWHPNVHSMLTEVTFCITCYLTVLAIEYALQYQQNLKGLIISNMMASIPAYNDYAEKTLMAATLGSVIPKKSVSWKAPLPIMACGT